MFVLQGGSNCWTGLEKANCVQGARNSTKQLHNLSENILITLIYVSEFYLYTI